ncbi:MAG: cysteine desulfurase/selenocysteine lyase [Flavobacteriales bacterium]
MTTSKLDIQAIRKQFPILNQKVNGYPLVYLDNAASNQKPKAVIDAITNYYETTHSNVHRGVHYLSQRATEAFEQGRETMAKFVNAGHLNEIVFTSGTTDSINLVAQSWGRKFLQAGDEIILSHLEHHSNIVPWQMVCEEKGATIKVIPVNAQGELEQEAYRQLLSDKTKLVAVNHISNTLGTINPIKQMAADAHAVGAVFLADGAQATSHVPLDVQDLDCDFYTISGHKMYGPTGIGILYGKLDILNAMPPWKGGGEMIKSVSFEKTEYNDLPHKFEAGTPHIEGVIALAAAAKWMTDQGIAEMAKHEDHLQELATEGLKTIDGLKLIGTAKDKASVVSFIVEGTHPFDIGSLLDQMGIAVRTGHHCTEPLMELFCIPGTVRASFSVYNTEEEVQKLIDGVKKACSMLL